MLVFETKYKKVEYNVFEGIEKMVFILHLTLIVNFSDFDGILSRFLNVN